MLHMLQTRFCLYPVTIIELIISSSEEENTALITVSALWCSHLYAGSVWRDNWSPGLLWVGGLDPSLRESLDGLNASRPHREQQAP